MSVIRQYSLEVAEGAGDSFRQALRDLVEALATISGFEGADLSQDLYRREMFVFREHWSSVTDHEAGGKQIPKILFTALMQSLAAPPSGAYLVRAEL